jgi:hypothetical protein
MVINGVFIFENQINKSIPDNPSYNKKDCIRVFVLEQRPAPVIFALPNEGGLAQLARAFAWHAKGHRFDSGNLHKIESGITGLFYANSLCIRSNNCIEFPGQK